VREPPPTSPLGEAFGAAGPPLQLGKKKARMPVLALALLTAECF